MKYQGYYNTLYCLGIRYIHVHVLPYHLALYTLCRPGVAFSKSASSHTLVRFWIYISDYSVNCIQLLYGARFSFDCWEGIGCPLLHASHKLAPLSQTVRRRYKTNLDLLTCIFPWCFQSAACILLWVLIGLSVVLYVSFVNCDWQRVVLLVLQHSFENLSDYEMPVAGLQYWL